MRLCSSFLSPSFFILAASTLLAACSPAVDESSQQHDSTSNPLFQRARATHRAAGGNEDGSSSSRHTNPFSSDSRRRRLQAPASAGGLDFESLAHWASPKQLKLLSQAVSGGNYWSTLLPSLSQQMSGEDAAFAFEHFQYLETMPAYKDFLLFSSSSTSSSNDENSEAAKSAAQLSALQQLVVAVAGLKLDVMDKDRGLANSMEQFVDEGGDAREGDVTALQSGHVGAMHRLQQAFADKYLGGVEVSSMYDNTWVEASRQALQADPMLQRILQAGGGGEEDEGDDSGGGGGGLLRVLLNPDVRLVDPATAAEADRAEEEPGSSGSRRSLYAAMMPSSSSSSS